MPSLDDNLEVDPSDISDLDEQAKPATAEPDAAASSAATGETDEDLLSIAQSVIKETAAKSASAPPAEGVEDPISGEPKKQDDEEYSDVPFHKHPRFQQLLRKAKASEQDAGRYNNVVNFLEQAGLQSDEAADALTIAGLIKTNPVEAWARMKPTVQKLLIAAGEVLPDDIQGRVQAGEMSREAAIEFSRVRAANQSIQAQQSHHEQQRQANEHRTFAASLQTAAGDWEQDRKIKDPNYAAKETAIRKEVLYLHATEGRPNTPEGVKAQLAKAYKAVNESYRPVAAPAQRPAIKPVVGGQVAGNPRPAGNMSTIDIIRANRQGG